MLGIEANAAEQWIDFSISNSKMMLSIYLTIPEIDNDIRGIIQKWDCEEAGSLVAGRVLLGQDIRTVRTTSINLC